MARNQQPRRRFGQHFLRDGRVIRRMVAAIAPGPADHFLEIGPGDGALTAPIAAAAGRLDCVELDRDLAAGLAARFQGRENIHIHCADVLRFDLAALAPLGSLTSLTGAGGKLRVAGNLPYNISTPVLFHLLKMLHRITDMTFMLQTEVVERMTAAPGSRDYGRLSVMLGYACEAERLFDVPPEAFRPRPRVMSSVVRLRPREPLPIALADEDRFANIVRAAFGQRRKTLRNSLKNLTGATTLVELGIDPEARPEQLAPSDYARISNAISADPGP